MERFFNIAGPCNPVDHNMLSAMARLQEVIREKTYDQVCRYNEPKTRNRMTKKLLICRMKLVYGII